MSDYVYSTWTKYKYIKSKEGFQWSGDSIHRECNDLRFDATMREIQEIKKEKRMERVKYKLKIDMKD